MKRLVLASFATLGLLATASPGHAQFTYIPPATSPFYRPPVSPYLNLALPGNSALNYFGLVQPQIQTANQLQILQGQLLQQQTLGGYGGAGGYGYPGAGVLITGYGAGFQNHWGFFQNWRTRGAVLGAGGLGGGLGGGPGLNAGAGAFGTTALAASRFGSTTQPGMARPGTGAPGAGGAPAAPKPR
jgi:hypothetical protein